MGRRITIRITIGLFGGLVIWCTSVSAQAPARPAQRPDANLLQLMRGTLFPASNVLFAAQDDLSKQPVAADPSTSPNPLTNTYGGWQAVENAGPAIAETARLPLLPGPLWSSARSAALPRA